MVREIVLGNQQLLVNLDQWMQVRDIYFPHVGQFNHLVGHAHKIAIVEGESISWLNGPLWEKDMGYQNETLVTKSSAIKSGDNLSLFFNENVYCEDNIFYRKITLENNSDYERTLRICFHHDFHLYGDGIGDTAFYSMVHDAIVHYKRSTYFLIGCCDDKNSTNLKDYDIGEDVEPGWNLNKNPISQGKVKSIICTDIILSPGSSESFCYYLCAGENLDEVFNLQKKFLNQGVDAHLKHNIECQKDWLVAIKPDISILTERLQNLYKRSLLILKTQIDLDGAILAANDSDNMEFNKDTYSYMWPRDGALVAIALIKAGFPEMTKPFFEFCRDVLYHEGCLLHKYNPDKTLGSSWHPWVLNGEFSLPIQEDETALVLHALNIYHETTKDSEFIKELYPKLIKPMGDFLANYRYKSGLPKESFGLWEERRAIFTFTTSAVLSGLIAAQKLGAVFRDEEFCESCYTGFEIIKKAMLDHLYNKEKKYFRRSVSFEQGELVYDDALDSSAYGIFEFGVFDPDDERVVKTMEKIRETLWVKTEIGGIARYYNDYYHQKSQDLDKVPGNPWFICTLWYAKWVIKKARSREELKEAMDLINWAAQHSLPPGTMAEQLHPYTGEALSVSPLTWSHAEFVDTITDYIEKNRVLK